MGWVQGKSLAPTLRALLCYHRGPLRCEDAGLVSVSMWRSVGSLPSLGSGSSQGTCSNGYRRRILRTSSAPRKHWVVLQMGKRAQKGEGIAWI